MSVRAAGATIAAIGMAFASRADAPSAVKAQVLVALASTKGTTIDPRLAHFAEDLKRMHLAYTNFTVVGDTSLVLDLGKSGEVKLPTGKTATVEFRQVDTDGKLRMKIHSPGRGYVTYSAAIGEEFIFQAASLKTGDVYLFLNLVAP
jgi:hypothetical protein